MAIACLAFALLPPALPAVAVEPVPVALDIPFVYEPERGAIVLQLVVNGRTAEVLLDTGAACTVLSTDFIGVPGGAAGTARFSSSQPGVRGDGVWMRAALSLGGRDLGRYPVRLMDLSEVSRVYKRRVDGLLGQDVLMRFDAIEIDFRARRLRLVGRAGDPSPRLQRG
jgi:hypothetical protein